MGPAFQAQDRHGPSVTGRKSPESSCTVARRRTLLFWKYKEGIALPAWVLLCEREEIKWSRISWIQHVRFGNVHRASLVHKVFITVFQNLSPIYNLYEM